MNNLKPTGFENYLSNYQPVIYDSFCGEPIAWGFKIIAHLGDEKFSQLRDFGNVECIEMGVWGPYYKGTDSSGGY